ncbi:hypothetical protein GCM10011506_08410 [Marivirga lumbricoides]|uniref:Transposase DDE domain-containing protein n=2 Tax=Marivirga lumbricoides TaxID=1046115 RepID=A0ABQ1LJC5_9BACT|nr:hypothetical protein GCM10011506_08410 [Marivirga lumbricoides]
MGLRKVNTLGIKQANKVMMMAAVAYNIKKYLKFTKKLTNIMSKEAKLAATYFIDQFWRNFFASKPGKITNLFC